MFQVTYKDRIYEVEHGCPFDRGSADSYYGRIRNPHKYPNGTAIAPRIESNEMTLQEIAEYGAGYNWNAQFGDKKSWE